MRDGGWASRRGTLAHWHTAASTHSLTCAQVLNKVNSRTGSVVSHSSSAAGALDLPPGASPTAAPPRGAQDAPPADPAELLRRWASPDSPSQSRQLQQQAPGEEAAGADGAKGQRSGSVGGPAHDGATRGVLRPDPRLWEGSKFMSNAASPPDLTPSLWSVWVRLGGVVVMRVWIVTEATVGRAQPSRGCCLPLLCAAEQVPFGHLPCAPGRVDAGGGGV